MNLTRFQSSGQTNADRRYEYARGLAQDGDFAAAADLYAQALELAPAWAACWFAYGEMLEKLHRTEEACAAFEKVITLMPDEPFGAHIHLYKLGKISSAPSANYITGLFDQYAARFETHLVKALQYRGPELLRHVLDTSAGSSRIFSHFIDLGCGTGLMAKALSGRTIRSSGVDLSPQMIQNARKSALYTALYVDELLHFLDMQPPASADLVLAADVFVYCGDLSAIFAAVKRILQPDGFFGFSVQVPEDGANMQDFRLGDDYRYAHAQAYIHRLADENRFARRVITDQSARQEHGKHVPGLIVLLASTR